jgi:adenylate kinase family enzyme
MASTMIRASSEFSVQSPQTNREPTKRRGGRKAVCPKYPVSTTWHGLIIDRWQMYTEEARKQRNRDAQAAFRERRIEYIKELEERVKKYSAKLKATETKRTDSADECLMLRYKNSLLERILVHKGMWTS